MANWARPSILSWWEKVCILGSCCWAARETRPSRCEEGVRRLIAAVGLKSVEERKKDWNHLKNHIL